MWGVGRPRLLRRAGAPPGSQLLSRKVLEAPRGPSQPLASQADAKIESSEKAHPGPLSSGLSSRSAGTPASSAPKMDCPHPAPRPEAGVREGRREIGDRGSRLPRTSRDRGS